MKKLSHTQTREGADGAKDECTPAPTDWQTVWSKMSDTLRHRQTDWCRNWLSDWRRGRSERLTRLWYDTPPSSLNSYWPSLALTVICCPSLHPSTSLPRSTWPYLFPSLTRSSLCLFIELFVNGDAEGEGRGQVEGGWMQDSKKTEMGKGSKVGQQPHSWRQKKKKELCVLTSCVWEGVCPREFISI